MMGIPENTPSTRVLQPMKKGEWVQLFPITTWHAWPTAQLRGGAKDSLHRLQPSPAIPLVWLQVAAL